MKVAAPFPFDKRRQEVIDEYNIEFNCSKHKLNDLISWLEKQTKRINIRIDFSEATSRINPLEVVEAISKFNNVYLRLSVVQGDWLEFIQEKKLKFFFDHDYIINSFCRLKDALEQGTTDVYILEDLCYRLPQARKLCNKYDASIRLIGNSISAFTLGRSEDPTAPWYVPENYNAVDMYYDTMEFELFDSWQRFDVLYKLWFIDHEWRDSLKFINYELAIDIPGESFPNELCEYKMTCGHRCIERQNACRKCEQYIELAKIMNKKGIEYTPEKIWVETNKDDVVKNILE